MTVLTQLSGKWCHLNHSTGCMAIPRYEIPDKSCFFPGIRHSFVSAQQTTSTFGTPSLVLTETWHSPQAHTRRLRTSTLPSNLPKPPRGRTLVLSAPARKPSRTRCHPRGTGAALRAAERPTATGTGRGRGGEEGKRGGEGLPRQQRGGEGKERGGERRRGEGVRHSPGASSALASRAQRLRAPPAARQRAASKRAASGSAAPRPMAAALPFFPSPFPSSSPFPSFFSSPQPRRAPLPPPPRTL